MYVLNQYGGTVSVIDPGTNTVTATIEVGNFPEGAICLPDGSAVYVPNYFTRTVSVIDPDTNTVTATVKVGADRGSRCRCRTGLPSTCPVSTTKQCR